MGVLHELGCVVFTAFSRLYGVTLQIFVGIFVK